MRLYDIKRIFRRRKYERVVAQQGGQTDDEADPAHTRNHSQTREYEKELAQGGGHKDVRSDPPSHRQEETLTYVDRTTVSNTVGGGQGGPQSNIRTRSDADGGPSSSAGTRNGSEWSFKMRPRVFGNHLRRQKSLKLRRTGSVSGMQTPARNVVQKFLDGPADMAAQEDAHKQDCRDLLRILSAKGNRVPGFA